MRNIAFRGILFISFLFLGCGNPTLSDYNETIVVSYNKLNEINKDITPKLELYVGKPEKLAEFKKIIQGYRETLLEARKPVDDLVPIKDSGFRRNCQDLFDNYETLLLTLNLQAEKFTAPPTPDNNIMDIILEKLKNISEAEQQLKESQYRFAEQNNARLH